MAKNIFMIRSLLRQETKSIREIASELINVLVGLGRIDSSFYYPLYYRQGFRSEEIDIKAMGIEHAKDKLAHLILISHLSDIKQYDKVDNPTIDFSRDLGFSHLLQFPKDGKDRFSLTGNLGTNSYPNFNIEYFYSDDEFSYSWYEEVLKYVVNTLNPIYAGVTITLTIFIDFFSELKVKHPFGWITYFSNDYDLQIPDDLEGVEYEATEKGKYIILTRKDFTTSKEAYEEQRDRLLSIMKEVKLRVSEYTR
jgi:hypothetical protein